MPPSRIFLHRAMVSSRPVKALSKLCQIEPGRRVRYLQLLWRATGSGPISLQVPDGSPGLCPAVAQQSPRLPRPRRLQWSRIRGSMRPVRQGTVPAGFIPARTGVRPGSRCAANGLSGSAIRPAEPDHQARSRAALPRRRRLGCNGPRRPADRHAEVVAVDLCTQPRPDQALIRGDGLTGLLILAEAVSLMDRGAVLTAF